MRAVSFEYGKADDGNDRMSTEVVVKAPRMTDAKDDGSEAWTLNNEVTASCGAALAALLGQAVRHGTTSAHDWLLDTRTAPRPAGTNSATEGRKHKHW